MPSFPSNVNRKGPGPVHRLDDRAGTPPDGRGRGEQRATKPDHAAERHRERRLDPAVPFKEIEQLTVRPRFAEAQVRDDVRGNIEGGLNGDLQRVLDESLFAQVMRDLGRAREPSKVRNQTLDEREL